MEIKDSKWIFLVGFFLILALPLLNLPPWFSPPDWGKTLVFRTILSLLIFIFIWQILFKKFEDLHSIWRLLSGNIAFWLLIALFGIFLLATIFSLDTRFSFWGGPYRAGGFLNFAFYIIFAVLAFLILRKSDWQKVLDFAIFVGILVSMIAIFQNFGLISKIIIPFETRPPSTLGGPLFLAIYLLLLTFITLSFLIREKFWAKKIFYSISFLLFILVAIFITQSRAAMIGLVIGSFFFIVFYPVRKFSTSLGIKLVGLIFLILIGYGIYFANTQQMPNLVKENELLRAIWYRVSIELVLIDPRFSGWKISLEAIKKRPILGYGPENFSIGFDRFYDPSLPGIEEISGLVVSWWDRAHNFVFDISVTAGIPALIIYLSLFGVLFFQLQRLKTNADLRMSCQSTNGAVVCHGIQATFIAYLTANFFSFDTFSSYLILFFLIGYSLHLMVGEMPKVTEKCRTFSPVQRKIRPGLTTKNWLIFPLFLLLIWFIWIFHLKPLKINKEINLAGYLAEKKDYQSAFLKMEKILPSHSYLDDYLRLKYIDLIQAYSKEKPEEISSLMEKAISLLRENGKLRPTYTRNWILLGSYLNILLEKKELPQEEFEKLKEEANFAFEKASQLSPKRQEIYTEWIKTDILSGENQKAKEKAKKCLDLNPNLPNCWWYLGITNIFLEETEKAKENIARASDLGYPINSEFSLLQLAKAYGQIKNYQELIPIYQKLIEIKPGAAQYHASLATCYKEIGDFRKAREEALRVLELMPETKPEVEEFLRTLK